MMNVLIAAICAPNAPLVNYMKKNKHNISMCTPVHMMDEIAISCWDMIVINIEENIAKWTGLIQMIKDPCCLPVIGLIGDISLADMQLGIEAGINDYIFQESSDLMLKRRLDIIFYNYNSVILIWIVACYVTGDRPCLSNVIMAPN